MNSKGYKKDVIQGIKDFSRNTAAVVNASLLALVYTIGVGTTALTAKLVGKQFLERNVSPEKETYWTELNLKKGELKDYYRQF